MGVQRVGAAPDPVFLLRRAQRIEVDHRLPLRLGLAVLGQRGAAPQAARVGGVLPQVVQKPAAARDGWDAVTRIKDLADAVARGTEGRPGFEALARRGVSFAHPRQCAFTLHLFEPEVGVFGRRLLLCKGRDGGHGDEQCGAPTCGGLE